MIKTSLRAKRSNPVLRFILLDCFVVTLLAMTAGKTFAQTYEYSPPPCEFTVSFPEEPAPEKRCDAGGKRCYDFLSFTQVFDLAATVNFRVICNPADKTTIDYYTPKVMEGTLEAMSKRATVKVEHYETSARESEDYRQAGLVGESEIAGEPTIYLAQLWVGKNSIFSIEGELIGETHKKADELFRDILRSVKFKSEAKQEEEDKKQ